MVKKHPKNLSLLTSPRSVLSGKKQIATTNNGCNTYYYGKRIGMIMWKHACMAWQGWCNATYPIKRNQNPDTHIYNSSYFTTRQFKCWLAWERQGMGELHKIKWSGETIIGNSQLLHMLLNSCNANYHGITSCIMQTSIWMAYSDSMHFSDKLSYKICFI
jgi:hypothetical protein